MKRNGRKPGRLPVLLLALAWVSGCATTKPAPPFAAEEAATEAAESDRGWWYARFRIHWPDGEPPRWHVGPLIAREVVAPVLEDFRETIELWRFHRRARRDAAGHQFSFIVYTSPEAAARIFRRIQESPVLEDLKARKLIEKDSYDDPQKIGRPGIGDTSDSLWSEPLRKAWPYFIMGVSQTWLDLVDRLAVEAAAEGEASEGGLEAFYGAVNERLVELWRDEGGHAFMHHLNALFGYEETFIYERRLMRF